MTREEFTRNLPPFAGGQLGVTPPLLFKGVSARVFPLRASLDTLQQMCDQYLNFVPREAGYFRVPLPYVYLVLLDYGQMGEATLSTGWFSQVEVYFGVFVEWYKLVRGQYVFHDFGVVTPYIFVDDTESVPVGRTVYGFPKVLAKVELTQSKWMKNPIAPATLARVATTVFPEAYAGGNLETRVFLEIEKGDLSNIRAPIDLVNPMMPWQIASNLANAISGFGRDAMWLAQAMRIFPVNPFADPRLLQQMLGQVPPMVAPGGSGFIVNSLNVKQFRRSSDPSKICYQALTNGCMKTTGFNAAGLLGEERTLLGDLSGGHSIRLYEHSSLPIARVLGLESHRTWNSGSVDIAEFKPVMPFWVDVDLEYDRGTNLAWRTDDGIWKDETGAKFHPAQRPVQQDDGPDFNNTASTSIEAITGPYQFTGTTIRVMPLLADRAKLQTFLEGLNEPLRSPIVHEDGTAGKYVVRFEVWSRPPQAVNEGAPVGGKSAYVYLAATSFGAVISESDNVGDWANYELSFLVPVKWQRMSVDEWKLKGEAGTWETAGVGLVPAYTFVDNCINAISRIEIQGIAVGTANFVRPESVWLGDQGSAKPPQTLLRVDVEVLSAMGTGQKGMFQPVIEIVRDALNEGLGNAPDGPWKWAEYLRLELGTKKGAKQQYFEELKVARALALELLGNQTPFAHYTMKQFRDVTDPGKACYQSLVRVNRKLTDVFDLREIEDTLAVKIYDYPMLNIVETLGIRAERLNDPAAGIVYSAQGIRPFYIRATVDEPLSERLLSRAATQTWTMHSQAFETMLSGDPGAPEIMVDRKAEKLQDQMDPSRTAETMFQARNRHQTRQVAAEDVIEVEQARAAVEVTDAQIVIESALSREWSNFSPDTRWRNGRQALLKGFNALPQGGPLKPYAEAELYRQLNNMMAAPPGSVAAMISVEFMLPAMDIPVLPEPFNQALDLQSWIQLITDNLKGQGAAGRWRNDVKALILSQKLFTEKRIELEHNVDMLSPTAILGTRGVQAVYDMLGDKRGPDDRLKELVDDGANLTAVMRAIQKMGVVGEPSPQNNLDTNALADEHRLGDMLDIFDAEMRDETNKTDPPGAILDAGRAHTAEEGEMVALARRKCDLQFQALTNKLSRAFQKPDFCVRRDAFSPADRERLLPLTLSWDKDWYYGDKISLSLNLVTEILSRLGVPDGTQLHPAESQPAAGS